MTSFIKLTAAFSFLLLSSFITLCGQASKQGLIVGNWAFEKFEFSGQLANIPPTEEKKANDSNKGLVIKFASDNKCSSEQKGGMTINNSKGTYKLLPNDKLIFIGDTVKIIQLDNTYLKLYRNDLSPIIIFRRQ
ncbi:MAG TPA: hypothetical protein VFU29_19480 [Chitinophagaceae bacterium]|nr:hypothetical protein [Chitinophagaceae bacterium]